MTEEEEEAIEYFKKRIDICMENADICDENNFDEEATYLRKEQFLIEIVLNLIQKQQEGIEELTEKLITERLTNKIISGNVLGYQENDKKMREELEKKDKIIDVMAEEFVSKTLMYSNNTKQEVIQHFKKKVDEK